MLCYHQMKHCFPLASRLSTAEWTDFLFPILINRLLSKSYLRLVSAGLNTATSFKLWTGFIFFPLVCLHWLAVVMRPPHSAQGCSAISGILVRPWPFLNELGSEVSLGCTRHFCTVKEGAALTRAGTPVAWLRNNQSVIPQQPWKIPHLGHSLTRMVRCYWS